MSQFNPSLAAKTPVQHIALSRSGEPVQQAFRRFHQVKAAAFSAYIYLVSVLWFTPGRVRCALATCSYSPWYKKRPCSHPFHVSPDHFLSLDWERTPNPSWFNNCGQNTIIIVGTATQFTSTEYMKLQILLFFFFFSMESFQNI